MTNKNQIIGKYDLEVEGYVKNLKSSRINLDAHKKAGYDKYAFILDRLEKFYFITNYISDREFYADGDERLLISLYNKAALDVWGIYYCLSNGLEIQSAILLRSLFETHITAKVILKENQKRRIKLYANFAHVERWRHICLHKEMEGKGYSNQITIDESEIKVYKKNYELVKKDYHPKTPIHWAFSEFKKNPSVKDLCAYLGDDYIYNYIFIYGTGSKHVHGSPILETYFVSIKDNKRKSLNSYKFTDSIINTSCLAIYFCRDVIVDILTYLKVKDYKDLSLYVKFYADKAIELGHSKLPKL